MCSVSAMSDYGRTRVPMEQWTRPTFTQFKEILERLEALDEKLNQPHCDDPAKQAWMDEVEKRLNELEGSEA